MKRVSAALQSPEKAWQFVTAPETAWADRMVVAQRASLPLSFMGRVEEAELELAREASQHRWGMLHFIPRYSAQPLIPHWEFRGDRRRKILGHEWTLPEEMIDEPLTYEEKTRAPWPWQVQQAMTTAKNAFFSSPEFYDAALTLPCRTSEEASYFYQLTDRFAITTRAIDPRVIGAWRNIGLNARMRDLRTQIATVYNSINLARADQYGEVMMADFARHWGDDAIVSLVFQLKDAAFATAVDALARRIDVIDPTASVFTRGYAASYFLQAVDPAALPAAERGRIPTEEDHERNWTAFRAWYAKRRDELRTASEKREPLLAPYRSRLEAVLECGGLPPP